MGLYFYRLTIIFSKTFVVFVFFGILRLFAFLPTEWAGFIAVILYVILEYIIDDRASRVLLQLILPKHARALSIFEIYNSRLNSIMNRKDLENQFNHTIKNAFKDVHLIVFWVKESYLESSDTNHPQLEIERPDISLGDKGLLDEFLRHNRIIFRLPELIDGDPRFQDVFGSLAVNYRLDTIIAVKSYRNVAGVIMIQNKPVKMLKLRLLQKMFERIIHKTAEIYERIELYEEVSLQSSYNEKLLRLSQLISSSLNLDEVLNKIMESIGELVEFDAAAIFLVEKNQQELKYQYVSGYDMGDLDGLRIKLNQGIVGKVIRSAVASNIPDVSKSKDYYPMRSTTRSQLTIPLYSGEKSIGALALESDKLNHFTQIDMEILKAFAGHASLAINNAWLYKEMRDKKELESDLLNAASVQKSLLQKRTPLFHGLQASISNIPCKVVGGDFYDFQKIDENRLILSIGDVAGKGAPGAILMAVVMAGLRSFYKQIYSICEITARVNDLLTDATTESKYATLFLAGINRQTKELVYTNAGHNAPILIHEDGTHEFLEGGGIVVGFRPGFSYQQIHVPLKENDILVMYTDGVVEAMNSLNEEFGIERLVETILAHRQTELSDLSRIIIDRVKNFTGLTEFDDDLTLMLFRINAPFFELESREVKHGRHIHPGH